MDPMEEILEDDGELYSGEGLDELAPSHEPSAPETHEDDELDLL